MASLFDSRLILIIKAHKDLNIKNISKGIRKFWKKCEEKGWDENYKLLNNNSDEIKFIGFQNLLNKEKKINFNNKKVKSYDNILFFIVGFMFGCFVFVLINKAKALFK